MKIKYLIILIIAIIILIVFISFKYQPEKEIKGRNPAGEINTNDKSLNNNGLQKDVANTVNKDVNNAVNNNEFVKFRTYKLDYSTGNAVAFSSSCDGSNLKQFGRTHDTCLTHSCSDTPELLIPAGDSKVKFWSSGDNVCICDLTPQSDITSGYARQYSNTDSDAEKVDSSGISTNPDYEVKCWRKEWEGQISFVNKN